MSLFLNKYEVSIVQGHFPDIFKKTRKPAGPVFRFSGFQKNLKTRGFRTLDLHQYYPEIFDTWYPTLLFLTPPPKSKKIELIVTLGNNQNFEVVPK